MKMEVGDSVPQYTRSNPSAQVPPFPMLTGEHPVLISKTADGNAMVTNYRFCACERRSFINIPLMMVGEVLMNEASKLRLRIGCKDGSTYSCTFATFEDCSACTSLLKEKTGQQQSWMTLFAYTFYERVMNKKSSGVSLTKVEEEHFLLCQPPPENPPFTYSFGREVERLGFDTSKRRIWRMSHANENFEFCPTYPRIHILPAAVDDDKLKISLDFRAMKRFPSVVWRDKRTGMVLIRSSQPLSSFLGVSYFTNHADVFLIEEIVKSCNSDWEAIVKEEQLRSGLFPQEAEANIHDQENGQRSVSRASAVKGDGAQGGLVSNDLAAHGGHGASNGTYYHGDTYVPKKLAIVDCRSLAGVWGNSFKGGGTEDEVVYKCDIIHLDLANIHTVRDSFNKLRALCHAYVEGTFLKNLAGCMWLTYISALLRGANIVVELMHNRKRPVLVHCSDGWDRTSQIVSLSELMMDPYYRTLEGFQVLVEREWLHFGHKFGERGGHDPNCNDTNQISPVFLQFLDCVYQLTLQYPAEFQFNEAYLVKLLQSSHSCLFGTFLHNCQKERENCQHKTASVWSLLRPERKQFINQLYRPSDQVLTAKFSEHDVVLWKSVYMAGLSPSPHISQADFYHDPAQGGSGEEVGGAMTDGMPRSKSMDDLSKISIDNGRRNSDPNITQSQEMAATTADSSSVQDEAAFRENFSRLAIRPSQSSSSPDEHLKDSSQKKTSSTKISIKQTPEVGENLSVSNDMPSTCVAQEGCAVPSLQDTTPELNRTSPEQIHVNGHIDNTELSNGHVDVDEISDFLAGDSTTENLHPSSSAVFCQENSCMNCGEETLYCDNYVVSISSQVLSDEKLSITLKDSRRKAHSCEKININSTGSVPEIAASLPKAASESSSSTSGYNSKQTSLLSERLAISSNSDLAQNGTAQIITIVNGKIADMNGEVDQHSMKSGNIYDHRATLKVHAHRELSSRKLIDSGYVANHCNGDDRNCGQGSKTGDVETRFMNGDASPSKSPDCEEMRGGDSFGSSANSVSTDTLMGDLEAEGSDCTPPMASQCSNPLEVNTQHNDRYKAIVPYTSSLSSSIHSSPMKRDGYQVDVIEAPGSNLISRRVRAASGASRDLSRSPCTCRGNWSDTGRLRHPSGSEMASRRMLGATVATSTTDISDSHVGQLMAPAIDRLPSIAQHIDIDGLTLFCDERQDLLAELVAEKDRKISDLERKLCNTLRALKSLEASKGRCISQEQTQAALDDFAVDSDAGELGSLGTISNSASDASWENIEESEAKIVLWVPDSAVTHCAGCDVGFWMYNRKHHCRNCGKVFCSGCSNYLAPVPDQHLNKPERVCRRCHSHLLQLSPGASSDGRIPTLVADG